MRPGPSNGVDIAGTVGGSAGVVAGAVIAARGVSAGERRLFDAVHDLPEWLDTVLWLPMQAGAGGSPVAVGAVSLLVTRRPEPGSGVVVAGLAAWFTAKAIKRLVGRGRPAVALDGFVPRAGASDDGHGYPSGHAAVAVATATTLSRALPGPWRWAPWVVVGVVAAGRIHNSSHLPLDVAGGAALGWALGSAWNLGASPARLRSRG